MKIELSKEEALFLLYAMIEPTKGAEHVQEMKELKAKLKKVAGQAEEEETKK